ncbi:hypothetical protein [Paenibacillus cymbidii]|uniref:hypothetical protein n=1 Tax=Paenibacillus cymbidii TaxID=1639034 RepID=UPI0010808428|nr:hypothetical protein [Paenibacillus cymbidii]
MRGGKRHYGKLKELYQAQLIQSYFDAGAKTEARESIRLLGEKYPRRAALLDELKTLDAKLAKAH